MPGNRNVATSGIVSYRIAASSRQSAVGSWQLAVDFPAWNRTKTDTLFPTQAMGLLQGLMTLIVIRMQIDIGRGDGLMAQGVADDT